MSLKTTFGAKLENEYLPVNNFRKIQILALGAIGFIVIIGLTFVLIFVPSERTKVNPMITINPIAPRRSC